MEITDEELEQIKLYAYDLMTWKDIAYLLGKDLQKFQAAFLNENNPIHLAYHRGRAERIHKLKVPVLKMAEMGAPQAEILAQKFIEEQEIGEADE